MPSLEDSIPLWTTFLLSISLWKSVTIIKEISLVISLALNMILTPFLGQTIPGGWKR